MITIERRTFQRSPAEWLNRAEAGEEIVIQSRGRIPLTIRAGKPAPPTAIRVADWDCSGLSLRLDFMTHWKASAICRFEKFPV